MRRNYRLVNGLSLSLNKPEFKGSRLRGLFYFETYGLFSLYSRKPRTFKEDLILHTFFEITHIITLFVIVYALFTLWQISDSRFRSVFLFLALLQFLNGIAQLVLFVNSFL